MVMSKIVPCSILLIMTRRIGDVLLATPLLRSLKAAWPQANIDLLVFAGTEGVLEGNPDVRTVLTIAERPAWDEHFALLGKIRRRYDLAISGLPGDRPTLYAWIAGKRRIAPVLTDRKSAWKTCLLQQSIPFDDRETHTVTMVLRLADRLGIARQSAVFAPAAALDPAIVPASPFAVLHPYPKFNYKMWSEAGWVALANALSARGVQIVLTGGPDGAEKACCDRIARASSATSLAGRLSLGQTGTLLRQARLFVGPDTAVTHMAAATGIPTLALFGPTNPVKWGPWPAHWNEEASPWSRTGSGRQGNVFLLQGQGDCVPCHHEGCDRHLASFSRCLQEMPAERVIAAAFSFLEPQAGVV